AHTLIFFFSSRRRHTRSKRDWSSDVCSSDLRSFHCPGICFCTVGGFSAAGFHAAGKPAAKKEQGQEISREKIPRFSSLSLSHPRSEERRVGKEWRSSWAREQYNEKNQNTSKK